MVKDGGHTKIFRSCTDPSGQEIFHFRASRSFRFNLIDPSLHDNVFIPNDFFEYTSHIGCASYLHSIVNSGLIPGGQIFEQKTDDVLQVTQRSGWKWPGYIASRLIQAENAEEVSKHCVFGQHQTYSKERIKLLSDAIERNHLYRHAPLVVSRKTIMMWFGEVIDEKIYVSPRPSLTISSECNWMTELDSKSLEAAKTSNSTQIRNPFIKNGETRGWTRIHPRDREGYFLLVTRTSSTQ